MDGKLSLNPQRVVLPETTGIARTPPEWQAEREGFRPVGDRPAGAATIGRDAVQGPALLPARRRRDLLMGLVGGCGV
jgi:hypothetical protein